MSALSARARATLAAVCARLVASDGDAESAATAVEARLAGEPDVCRKVDRLLVAIDHPVTALLGGRRPRRFTALPAAEQDAFLREWAASRLALKRSALEGLRRIVLSTYYAIPRVAAEFGHLGPPHLRPPRFAWEGPAAGESSADEPVSRVDRASPARPPILTGIIQAHELVPGASLRAEVCVIGSGAGGSVVAARLAEAGRDVIVLEEGGYWTPAEFTENEDEMVPRLYADAGLRATADVGLSLLQGRCAGGGTTVNWMIMLRPPQWVMEEWERVHGAELLGPASLGPALDRITDDVHSRMVPDDAHSPSNRIILDGAAKLGWRASAAPINARDCVRAGTCGLGCRYRAKQSALETWLPRAVAAGARVLCGARADRLIRERDGARPLTRVAVTTLNRDTRAERGTLTIEAPIVVLAAGAVGTPVLLQRSGLGGGAVGKFLRLHPTTGVMGTFQQPMYAASGIPQSAVCTEFLDRNGGFGFWIECPPLLPGLGAAALPGFGAAHREQLNDFTSRAPLIVLVRDGANAPRSQGDVTAIRGGTRIRYRLRDAERTTLAEGIHAAVQLQFAAGAHSARTLHEHAPVIRPGDDYDWILRATSPSDRIGLFSAHVNGTCRMGADPRTSGCAPDGQRHGTTGIYIADGSILPSAPGANPQATIMAAATLVAEGIVRRLGR